MGAAGPPCGFEPACEKGLRDCISPTCTLSQNGYGACMCHTYVHRARQACLRMRASCCPPSAEKPALVCWTDRNAWCAPPVRRAAAAPWCATQAAAAAVRGSSRLCTSGLLRNFERKWRVGRVCIGVAFTAGAVAVLVAFAVLEFCRTRARGLTRLARLSFRCLSRALPCGAARKCRVLGASVEGGALAGGGFQSGVLVLGGFRNSGVLSAPAILVCCSWRARYVGFARASVWDCAHVWGAWGCRANVGQWGRGLWRCVAFPAVAFAAGWLSQCPWCSQRDHPQPRRAHAMCVVAMAEARGAEGAL